MIVITSIASKLGIHTSGLDFVIVENHGSKVLFYKHIRQGPYVLKIVYEMKELAG